MFFQRITSVVMIAWLAVLGAGVPARAADTALAIDDGMQSVKGWAVGFSRGIGGCVATATFTDGTAVWIGFGRDLGPFIAFTNAKWQSLEVQRSYPIQINTNGYGTWRGSFVGISRNSDRGLINAGLKTEFLHDFAKSERISVAFGGRQVTQVSLIGSRAALEQAIECNKERGTSTSAQPRPASPTPRTAEKGTSSGTGFFVSSEGHVLTNHHVVAGCTTFEINRVGALAEPGRLIASDEKNDLALLKTGIVPPVVPGLRTRVRVGEGIAVFGFPLSGLLATSGNFTQGNVTALAGLADDTRMLQISAPVQPGNSGGPLIDSTGNVVGVIVSKLNALSVAQVTKDLPQNVNFAIKTAIAVNFLESNSIAPVMVGDAKTLDGADIAERAKEFTVRIVCRH